MVQSYNGTQLSNKIKLLIYATTQIKCTTIMLSERSQTQKNACHMIYIKFKDR